MADVSESVAVLVGGQRLSAWTSIKVHRSCEALPNSFEMGFSGTAADPSPYVVEGSPCEVMIGSDLVLTGYVDQVVQGETPEDYTFTLAGRGKTSDLVDCSAEWKGSLILQTDVGDVARKLCEPYGITVGLRADISANANQGAAAEALKLPAMGVTLIETPAALLTEVAHYYGVLMYESAEGELVFERGGDTLASGGFVAGQNLMTWTVLRSAAERFSSVVIEAMPAALLSDTGDDVSFLAEASDPNVRRHRLHRAVGSAPALGPEFAQREARWEVAKRAGVSRNVRATVDGWRDAGGVLWTPNTRAVVNIPQAGFNNETMVLSEVTFTDDAERGPVTEVLLVPPAALAVEPIAINPIGRDANNALTKIGAGA